MNKNKFFATIASNQGGPGYIEIHAIDEADARSLISVYTNGRWAFMYNSLDEIHISDRKCLGIIGDNKQSLPSENGFIALKTFDHAVFKITVEVKYLIGGGEHYIATEWRKEFVKENDKDIFVYNNLEEALGKAFDLLVTWINAIDEYHATKDLI